jgi:hypothetical protein
MAYPQPGPPGRLMAPTYGDPPPHAKFATRVLRNLHNIASSSAPWPSARGKPISEFGTNGKHPTASCLPGLLCFSVKPSWNMKTTLRGSSCITLAASLILDNRSTYSVAYSSITSGRKDAVGILATIIPSRRFSSRPRWRWWRSIWPLGRPLDLTSRLGILTPNIASS